ncbi:MAG: family 43 glycosylhydrolase [Pontiellaceae bacterium]|nr:family 43 glycosylhydrolase [Pontiellaceae bacterium]MBN2785612.1 family 43 glycosylhydrolase [Pontiellaceae bacterium]
MIQVQRCSLSVAMFVAACFSCALPGQAQEPINGYAIYTHDPSTLIKTSGRYYYFGTSQNLVYHWSTDLRNWNNHGYVFASGIPAWTTEAVPTFTGHFWAPDVAFFNGKYHVYYSISEWGTIDSAIGLVTTPSLTSPSWTDQGKVVQSDAANEAVSETDTTAFNCIDPSILVDDNGSVWMTFGSYSSGILVTEINPVTGLRMNTTTLEAELVANNSGYRGWGSSIEAAFTYKHAGYYYLFVNYGGCCSGVDSTYNIRVGRSTSVTGPYYDKDGVDMRDAGGTMLLESSGRFIGPGHSGILNDNGTEWFSYHYYDGNENGASKFSLLQVGWDADEWPVLSDNWSAFYPFSVDASEHMDRYDGELMDGAGMVNDDLLGDALELDGSGYVRLSNSVANCSSIAAWVKWDGGAAWQRIFDFGNGTSDYMFLTPMAWNAGLRFAIRKDNEAEQVVAIPEALPADTWCHLAVTLDGVQGVLYLNGHAVASNSVSVRPWELMATSNYVGRSQWPDPGFDGRIASFRVFAHALNADEVKEIAAAHPALAHRYRFVADGSDSIGMAHGKLKGSAAISDEKLHLPGTTGSYADLPGGLVSGCHAVSIEFWADVRANGNWARIFDFGNHDGTYGNSFLFFSPRTGFSDYRLVLNDSVLSKTGGTLNSRSEHVVCILDPAAGYGAVYVDAVLRIEQSGSLPLLSTVSPAYAFLGRSLFVADPYLNADIDEFRIYDGRLSQQEVIDHFAAGPDADYPAGTYAWTNNAGNISFEWPTYPAGYELEFTTKLQSNTVWSGLPAPLPEGGSNRVSVSADSISASNAFFRIRHW